jgi:hypothetical protein
MNAFHKLRLETIARCSHRSVEKKSGFRLTDPATRDGLMPENVVAPLYRSEPTKKPNTRCIPDAASDRSNREVLFMTQGSDIDLRPGAQRHAGLDSDHGLAASGGGCFRK